MNKEKTTDIILNALFVLLLLLLYTLISIVLLPDGINKAFLGSLWRRIVLPIPPLVLLLGIHVYFFNDKKIIYAKRFEKLSVQDWFFILIPILPIGQYVIANSDFLSAIDSIFVLLPFIALTIIVCVFVPVFLSFLASKYMLIAASTALLFTVLNMASVSSSHNWTEEGELWIQLIVFAVILSVMLLSRLLPRKLVSNIIMLLFIVNIGMTLFGHNATELIESENAQNPNEASEEFPLQSFLEGREMQHKNDIFLIVFESYAPYETMLHYGFDNKEQISFLEKNEFTIYDGIYSTGASTKRSLSAAFNLGTEYNGRLDIAGKNVVKSLFKNNDYQTYYITQSGYMNRGFGINEIDWDYAFPPLSDESFFSKESALIINAILEGEFSDEVSLKGVGYEEYLTEKWNVFSTENNSPIFMYSHSYYPGHSPNSGVRSDIEKYVEQYLHEKLPTANEEMRNDLALIDKHNPEAIVIIAGDHGPYLTKNGTTLTEGNYKESDIDRYDIQDRYGAFLAVRWPEQSYSRRYNIQILQDIFPAILAYLYADDSLFDKLRIERTLQTPESLLGITVQNGIIQGGQNDGEPLFIHDGE